MGLVACALSGFTEGSRSSVSIPPTLQVRGPFWGYIPVPQLVSRAGVEEGRALGPVEPVWGWHDGIPDPEAVAAERGFQSAHRNKKAVSEDGFTDSDSGQMSR